MFDTFGPFVLANHDSDGIEDFYRLMQNDKVPDLDSGVGIYIIAARAGEADFLPWYVGKTSRAFGTRFIEHFKGGKFADLAGKGSLYVHLIALANQGQIISKDYVTERQHLMIEQLEQQLIDHCVRLNPSLLNKKKWSVNQVHVPGYIDKGGSERDFPAAQKLAELLKT